MIHNKHAFVGRFGGVYEHSPWVAEKAFDMGPPAPEALPGIMREIVEAAGHDAQLTLLHAHPDLAGKHDGKALHRIAGVNQRGALEARPPLICWQAGRWLLAQC